MRQRHLPLHWERPPSSATFRSERPALLDHGRDFRSAEQAEDDAGGAHLVSPQLEHDPLLLDPQMLRRDVRDQISSRGRAFVAQQLGELGLAGEDAQRRPQERRRLACQRLRGEVPGQGGDEGSERVQALADQSFRKLGRRRDGLADPASLEEPARRPGRRVAEELVPAAAPAFSRPTSAASASAAPVSDSSRRSSVLRFIGSAGSESRRRSVRIWNEPDPPPWRCRSVPRPASSSVPTAPGSCRSGGRIDGAAGISQPSLSRARRHWSEGGEQGAQPAARAQCRRRGAADVGTEHGDVVEALGRRLRRQTRHQSSSSGEAMARAGSPAAPTMRTERPSSWTRPSAQSAIARG